MSINDMFEYATRHKLRFTTVRGLVLAEDLWDMPLRGNGEFNLDVLAKATNRALKNQAEESFVETKKTPVQVKLEVALDIVKYVIQAKLEEEAAAAERALNKLKKEKLLKALAEKQEGKLSAMSEKELLRQIEALET